MSGEKGTDDRRDDDERPTRSESGSGDEAGSEDPAGTAADEYGSTVAHQPDTVAGGYGERTIDHRAGDEGRDATARHRRTAASLGHPSSPDEPEVEAGDP